MAEAGGVVNPLVEQFRRGAVPLDLRLLAAQCALPLGTEDLLELLTDLVRDADAGVRAAAEKSLVQYPAGEVLPVLRSRDTVPAVLSWMLAHRPERELREAVLQNAAVPDEAMVPLAGSLPQALAELVVINQTRLLRHYPLLVAIEGNPALSNDQKRRLRELRESFHVGEEAVPPPAEPELQPVPPAPAEPAGEPELAPVSEAVLSEADAMVRYLSEEERQQFEKVSAVQKIYRLNTAEKINTALKGSREERALLVRDPNRIVSVAVLGSPRLTDAEIESFAAMKNVSDEILRHIGNHREWTKRYAVVSNLVRNPRTPIGIALTLVPRLNPRDLKGLAVDRNVPETVRKHAQKFIKTPERR
jgi:hypothetical protein